MRGFLVATLVLVASVIAPSFSTPLGVRDNDFPPVSRDNAVPESNPCKDTTKEQCVTIKTDWGNRD